MVFVTRHTFSGAKSFNRLIINSVMGEKLMINLKLMQIFWGVRRGSIRNISVPILISQRRKELIGMLLRDTFGEHKLPASLT